MKKATLTFSWYNYYDIDICEIEQVDDFDYKVTYFHGNESNKFESMVTTSSLPRSNKEAQALCYRLFG